MPLSRVDLAARVCARTRLAGLAGEAAELAYGSHRVDRVVLCPRGSHLYSLSAFLVAGGCVRRDGCNSDCEWAAETGQWGRTSRQVGGDAEFAEDSAIH
jgi:hypothetical protein